MQAVKRPLEIEHVTLPLHLNAQPSLEEGARQASITYTSPWCCRHAPNIALNCREVGDSEPYPNTYRILCCSQQDYQVYTGAVQIFQPSQTAVCLTVRNNGMHLPGRSTPRQCLLIAETWSMTCIRTVSRCR